MKSSQSSCLTGGGQCGETEEAQAQDAEDLHNRQNARFFTPSLLGSLTISRSRSHPIIQSFSHFDYSHHIFPLPFLISPFISILFLYYIYLSLRFLCHSNQAKRPSQCVYRLSIVNNMCIHPRITAQSLFLPLNDFIPSIQPDFHR